MIEASSFQIIYWEAFGRQIQDVLNRCHTTIREPTDLPEAQGFPASAIRRAGGRLGQERLGQAGPPILGAGKGRIPGGGLGVDVKSEAACPR